MPDSSGHARLCIPVSLSGTPHHSNASTPPEHINVPALLRCPPSQVAALPLRRGKGRRSSCSGPVRRGRLRQMTPVPRWGASPSRRPTRTPLWNGTAALSHARSGSAGETEARPHSPAPPLFRAERDFVYGREGLKISSEGFPPFDRNSGGDRGRLGIIRRGD